MPTYLCDDGNAEIEITADSAQEAAQEYVDGGDWNETDETLYVDVYVEEILVDSGARRDEIAAAIEYVQSHDDDTAEDDEAAEAFRKFFGRDPDKHDAPWSDLCAAIGEDDTVEDHMDLADPIKGERECITITVEPDEPECADDQDHDWQSPHEVLGGLEENPGVQGHGGGVIIREVCAHCGKYKITDTWANHGGQQGFTSVKYEDADERSREWARDQRICSLRTEVERVLDAMDAVTSYRDGDSEDEITIINGLRDGVDIDDVIAEIEARLGDRVYVRDLDPMPEDGKPDLIAIETP